ncbi:MAG TPA: NADH-ubiquinone oxidoreductase-F iron-sulfur binding region domain-containing protein [Acidimicrobiia bacterium]|nr:NADH-ubiquinone oxidoreductase-F iron-sulfur binding region domain-containing protein [Acidimicrobiia bacterium]
MTLVHRVLYPTTIETLEEYLKARGGKGLEAARRLSSEEIIVELESSGLRGRGGAGFPTGRKWRTVRDYCSRFERTTVVVNAAEGEPGTFKDRTIIRNDPFQVLEGALIAAHTMKADEIIVATKRSFSVEVDRLRAAIDEVKGAGWSDGVEITVFEGPNEYLYGEETALLETIDGRYPLPRIAPPYRRGVTEVVETPADLGTGSGLSAHVEMAGPDSAAEAPPALVDNVETLANVAHILARGAEWFRTEGTAESPGTIVCTVTGSTVRAGVGEVLMGTPLRDVIETIGGGARPGHQIRAVLPGVSSGFIAGAALDTPVSYEALAAIGSGLGSAGFVVFDDSDDLVAVAAGASRFLAVESCGQCTPCKLDGLHIAELLAMTTRGEATKRNVDELRACISTVADGARCSLATQQQVVADGLLEHFPADVDAHIDKRLHSDAPHVFAELVDIVDGVARIDERHAAKNPDWTYDSIDSGKTPAERLGEHREPEALT